MHMDIAGTNEWAAPARSMRKEFINPFLKICCMEPHGAVAPCSFTYAKNRGLVPMCGSAIKN